jgi:hypothetical protein
MAPRISRLVHPLPAWRTDHSRTHDVVVLALSLTVALVGLVPAFALTVRQFSLPIPLPALAGVGIVLAAYAAAAVLIRRVAVGALVALGVLSTVAANVPLTSLHGRYPGLLGPELWLVMLPLAVCLVIAIGAHYYRGATISRTHILFVAFVGWAVVTTFLGAGPRTDAALFFALHFALAALTFGVVALAVERRILSLRLVAMVLAIALLGHAGYLTAELINQGSFGLIRLGDAHRVSTSAVVVRPFRVSIGAYLTGLMGGTASFSSLVILIAPVFALYGLLADSRRWKRYAALACAVALFALARLTMKDAVRGAVLVVVCLLAVAVAVEWHTDGLSLRQRVAGLVAGLAAVAAVLYPSTKAGKAVQNPGTAKVDHTTVAAVKRVAGLDIPLFDLSSLGIRVRQQLTALDLALSHPIVGLGGANFAAVIGGFVYTVHNAYLIVLVGTGVPGLVLFVGLLVSILGAAIKLWANESVPRWLSAGVACGMIGYFALLFWTMLLLTYTGTYPFWILAGAVVGERAVGPSGTTPRKNLD